MHGLVLIFAMAKNVIQFKTKIKIVMKKTLKLLNLKHSKCTNKVCIKIKESKQD